MSFAAYTPTSYFHGVILVIAFFLSVVGLLVGAFLAGVVKARVMLVGSMGYWVVALPNLLYNILFFTYQPGFFQSVSTGLFWSMFLAVGADVAYVVKYFVKKRRTQP